MIWQRVSKKRKYLAVNEQFKLIRSSLDFASIDQKKQLILITSPETSSGKSTISSHLAVTYAQRGERTLLIDADLRKPTIHQNFQLENFDGLSTLLTENINLVDVLRQVTLGDCTFSILTSGIRPPNPNDLLSSKKMMQLLDDLRENFEKIIIDTPPVTIVSDALVLADSVDGTILVCRYHKTFKDKAMHATNQLRKSQSQILGVIFNGTKSAENYYY